MHENIDGLSEVIFSSASNLALAQKISRLAKSGMIKQIRPGIYTSNLKSPLEAVVHRNWKAIAEHLFPSAVVAYRSAIKGGPVIDDGHHKLFLVKGDRAKRLTLPGLEIVIIPGAAPTQNVANDLQVNDVQYGQLYLSSEPRRFLENLSRAKGANERSEGREWVEKALDHLLQVRGEQHLNALRDNARLISGGLGLSQAFDDLNKIIGALQATHQSNILVTNAAIATSKGTPYDAERINKFDALFAMLNSNALPSIPAVADQGTGLENFSFFEAYFSNFIEGTEFTVEEAESIVFDRQIIENRSNDSHDVYGTFEAVIAGKWRSHVPASPKDFILQIRNINALVMQAHPSKNPGELKTKLNQAGSTIFVSPERVVGTLNEGFERIKFLSDPMAKALMMMYVISEVHPFADGNGRTARIAMNACLSNANASRIIIPTIYREDYLLPLKSLTNHGDPTAYIQSMVRAANWSAAFDWGLQRSEVIEMLANCNAFEEDLSQFKLIFPSQELGVEKSETRKPKPS